MAAGSLLLGLSSQGREVSNLEKAIEILAMRPSSNLDRLCSAVPSSLRERLEEAKKARGVYVQQELQEPKGFANFVLCFFQKGFEMVLKPFARILEWFCSSVYIFQWFLHGLFPVFFFGFG